jgi:hypothetical protein
VVNGQVIGIWRRTTTKGKVIVGTEFFKQPSETSKRFIEKAVIQFGRFLDKKLEIGEYQ